MEDQAARAVDGETCTQRVLGRAGEGFSEMSLSLFCPECSCVLLTRGFELETGGRYLFLLCSNPACCFWRPY